MPQAHVEPLTGTPSHEGVDAAVAATRRVMAALLRVGVEAQAPMREVTTRLEAIADDLAPQAGDAEEQPLDLWASEGLAHRDPVTGPRNAIAPPLQLTGRPDGSVVGVVSLGLAYQGPPGHVHGGVSALLLDHTLGVANGFAGSRGMTARLQLRYTRPAPLFVPLTVTARQLRVEGRRIWAEGAISVDGAPCVTAEGLFVEPRGPVAATPSPEPG